jgi:hypothetical protein
MRPWGHCESGWFLLRRSDTGRPTIIGIKRTSHAQVHSSARGEEVSELAAWDSVYVIVGSAAGALVGLRLIVMTLIAARPPLRPKPKE